MVSKANCYCFVQHMKDIISNDQHGDNVNQLGGGGEGAGRDKRKEIK